MKIGFINGKCRKPDPDDPSYAQWERCDNMVFSWILNSIQSDLAEAFLYATSSEELWNELEERFGESNGPLIYQIEKKITDIRQNNDSVGAYFTKLKKLWDELANVTDPAVCECNGCTCDAKKKLAEAEQKRRLIKFLMGLNEGFDTIRGQIMLIEPLPTATYAGTDNIDSHNMALYAGKGPGQRQNGYNKTDPRKNRRMCEYCKEPGHFKDQCFKLIGYPEWFKGPKGKKGQNSNGGTKFAAHTTTQTQEMQYDTPLEDMGSQKGEGHIVQNNPMFIQHVAQKMMRMMSDRSSTSAENATLNAYAHLAGKFCTIASIVLDSHSAEICCVGRNIVDWIVHTRASNHMTPFEDILFDVYELPKPITVTLPDGNHKAVNKAGKVVLSSSLILMDVLYVPDFRFSLISVSKVIDTQRVNAVFLADECVFQDPSTKQIMATAPRSHGLYKMRIEHKDNTEFKKHGMTANTYTLELLHDRLGHTSMSKMKHISGCSVDDQHKSILIPRTLLAACQYQKLKKIHKILCVQII
ncbi:unnamed protein product [Cuscuta campestris]|uniref:Uncharacterized protein n=1 Tax=Cuscuta campestris TaxID=132261 RepID=A0A484N439_9ASTE|nr:unnamed protein product [Cuscuta campestris]